MEKQRANRDEVLGSEFDKWCFGGAVIELLNLLIFQMMFALSQPYVLRARERSLEASDRGHVWVTLVVSSDMEVSQLKETPSKVQGASHCGMACGELPEAYLRESEGSVSKCLPLASGYLAPDK